jgi:uncharacterized protein GlcG (DUF336 family)
MTRLTLDQARSIVGAALAKGRAEGFKPLTVVVLDAGGHVVAAEREDGSSNLRFEIAFGKANAALAMGLGTRSLMKRAEQQAYFVQAVNGLAGGRFIPVPGGVLVRDEGGTTIGAVGISGDTSDADELCALAGIAATGLVGDPG